MKECKRLYKYTSFEENDPNLILRMEAVMKPSFYAEQILNIIQSCKKYKDEEINGYNPFSRYIRHNDILYLYLKTFNKESQTFKRFYKYVYQYLYNKSTIKQNYNKFLHG